MSTAVVVARTMSARSTKTQRFHFAMVALYKYTLLLTLTLVGIQTEVSAFDVRSNGRVTSTIDGIHKTSTSPRHVAQVETAADFMTEPLATLEEESSAVLDAPAFQKSASNGLWKLALAGVFASVVGDTVMHPLDCIKTLQQSDAGAGLGLEEAAAELWRRYNGIGGFYQGIGTYLASDGIGGALKFATFEQCKESFLSSSSDDENEEEDSWKVFFFAALAFLVSSFVVVPGEFVKQQLQMGYFDGGLSEGLKTTIQERGIGGFFAGYDGVCFREIPYTMMELGLYDQLQRWVRSTKSTTQLTNIENMLVAAVVGGLAGFFTTPLDTIKTKLMVDSVLYDSGFLDCAGRTLASQGVGGLFAGASARVAWLVPFTAIYLPTYDFIKGRIFKETEA